MKRDFLKRANKGKGEIVLVYENCNFHYFSQSEAYQVTPTQLHKNVSNSQSDSKTDWTNFKKLYEMHTS